ncbi:BURP domain-containing protein BNM2C-like [Salvia miltiorrhiza]|uniref:BURP domain-containing protein BNM2C-like n=1 Tax=Salvia miltiorrhiza TaxID=226208 RepID=UPI0025ACC02A|nr:BURP domain-containing protein BNM2C-like [Salvia miltiorrhiza]
MYAKLTLCTLLLHLLILLGSSDGAVIDNHIQQVHSHMHHDATDPSLIIFFFPKDLKLGNTMKIYFPKRELSDSLTHLISKEEADSIPFSSQSLPQILRLFSFSDGSPQATAMAATLDECDRQPIQGEKKFCATSLKSMSEFLETIFGSGTPVEALSTSHLKRSESDDGVVQRYRIMGIQQIPSPKLVSCHTMPYAYTVFYCHYHDSDNRVYRVSLAGENGDAVEAVAVCHMDTSQWGRGHVAFGVLGVEPGSTPVCHFFPADNFVWVPLMSAFQM